MEALGAIVGLLSLFLTLLFERKKAARYVFGLTATGKRFLIRVNQRAEARTRLYLDEPSALIAYLARGLGALACLTLCLWVSWALLRAALGPQGIRPLSSYFLLTLSTGWGALTATMWSELEDVLSAAKGRSSRTSAPIL